MFTGSLVALVTPFRDGKVDLPRLEELVEFHVEAGTNGLVPCGTTGESATLSHEEHELVIRSVLKFADGRIPVLAGTGSNSTQEALKLTRFAKEAGADGALLITPYYNKPTQRGLVAHFEAVARQVDLPLVLYNVPSRTGVNMLPQTVVECSRLPNIVGIKEASGNVDQTVEILRGSEITVLSGDDSLTLPLMSVGAKGVISVAANVAPKMMVDLVDLAAGSDFTAAREVHFRLFPLFKALFVETNPIPVKAALVMMGRIGPELRLPLTPLDPTHSSMLKRVLSELGL
ncbi:MAG TPA: 4-hydroxy-tetrahydrodipicolinate synthase [Planctomycetota bacterium]|jgi:4-hydroxy-tetrahydrodipicolinate synthase|nr:4-hydroxy-tetrahydrodipicolinate synthase [Planctomycetota bacterium]